MSNTLPSELERAKYLLNRLHSAIGNAKRFKLNKTMLDVAEAEELSQLLADSLRTIDQFDLVEFDGTIKPQRRLGHS